MRISTFFTLLTISGAWRPISWSSPFKIVIYNVYTLFLLFVSFTFLISQIGSIFTMENLDDFVDNAYMTITILIGSCKFVNVLLSRKDIINLMNFFLEEPCNTSNTEEAQIQTRYDKQVRRNALRYTAMIQFTVYTTILSELLTNFRQGKLTYRAWIPYDYTDTFSFSLTFVHQQFCVLSCSLVHVATDVLFFGSLIQICCQYDILLSRLNDITSNSRAVLQRYVRHHNCIYQLSGMLNDALYLTVFVQFFGNFLVLCLSMTQLLKTDTLSGDFFTTIFFLASIMVQSFLYCWYGNELKLKSINLIHAIFHIDWTRLNKDERKILLITMCRTRSPIELETAHVITVNVDFFVVLVKSSYSMYNVLQNTRK